MTDEVDGLRPVISIVIPCRNGADVLGEQLDSLMRQDCAVCWEIIVVDDASTDSTGAVAASYESVPVRVVVNPGPHGAAAARNLGASVAQADLLLFLDADDSVNPGYVRAMLAGLGEHGLVTSLVDFATLNGAAEVATCPRPKPEGPHRMFGFLPHAGGGAIGIRRTLFESLGGFDETLPWLHDADLCWRAHLEAGAPLHVVTDAVEYVRLRSTPRALYRQGIANGRDGIRLRYRYQRYGVPLTPWSRHLRQWWKTFRALSGLGTAAGRNHVAWRLGKQIGRLQGILTRGA